MGVQTTIVAITATRRDRRDRSNNENARENTHEPEEEDRKIEGENQQFSQKDIIKEPTKHDIPQLIPVHTDDESEEESENETNDEEKDDASTSMPPLLSNWGNEPDDDEVDRLMGMMVNKEERTKEEAELDREFKWNIKFESEEETNNEDLRQEIEPPPLTPEEVEEMEKSTNTETKKIQNPYIQKNRALEKKTEKK